MIEFVNQFGAGFLSISGIFLTIFVLISLFKKLTGVDGD